MFRASVYVLRAVEVLRIVRVYGQVVPVIKREVSHVTVSAARVVPLRHDSNARYHKVYRSMSAGIGPADLRRLERQRTDQWR